MEKDWLSKEKIVSIIEKSISPNSIVQHNVRLIDLTSKKEKKRQCDIVIKSGTPNRQTTTIVEVQSRGCKFNINIFQGLVQKMRDVGAQHLICVSTKGFPDSIIEKAKELGNTVRLIKLNENEPEKIPIELPNFEFVRCFRKFDSLQDPEINFKTDFEIEIKLSDMIFQIPGIERSFNYISLVNFYITNILKSKYKGEYLIKFPFEELKLNIHFENYVFNVINFSWRVFINFEKHKIPSQVYSYEQLDHGILAWFIESTSTINNIPRTIQIPITINEDGHFKCDINYD